MNSQVLRSAIVLFCLHLCLPLTNPALASGAGSFRDIKMSPNRDLQAEGRGELRTDTQEVIRLLKAESLVANLRAAKQAGVVDTAKLPRATQQARLLCLWKIFVAMEEVRKVVSIINRELSSSYVNLDALTSKRDMTANVLNTVNFMQGGILGVVSKGISFKYGYPIQSKEVSEVSFSIGTALPTIGFFLPSLWSRKIDSAPNTLAHVFNTNYRPVDAEHSYLWRFMNGPIPGSDLPLTRREILIKHWEAFEAVNCEDLARVKRLSATVPVGENMSENIRVISQRIDLLHDLKTHLEEFDGSLYEFHKAITFD